MSGQARERCLGECMRAVADALELGPGLRRKIWARGTDWVEDVERLTPLLQSLPILEPRSAVERIDQAGGPPILRTEKAHAAIRHWGTAHRIPEVLRWFSLVIPAAMAAHRDGALSQREYASVMRSVPVLAMSAFLPRNEELWKDVSSILGARVHDTPDMLRGYRQAVRRGDKETLLAVDARICCDPDWGPWARPFPDLAADAARPRQVPTAWEFPDADQTRYDDILRWLFRSE